MNNIINQSETVIKNLPILTDEEAKRIYNKGWSFFNVYSIRELRDIFIIYSKNEGLSLFEFTSIVNQYVKYEEREWNERRVLEILNALKNLKMIGGDVKTISNPFPYEELNGPLTPHDKEIFILHFFSYFRFKEISSWFISPEELFHQDYIYLTKERILNESKVICYYSNNSRFTNTFLYLDNIHSHIRYAIPNHMSHVMRFWDVYLKWGTTLGILEKFSLSVLNIKIDASKDVNVAYFIMPFKKFDFISYVRTRFNSRDIFIPQIIFEIAKEFKYSIEEIKRFILEEIKTNDKLTYERTSEIFIIKGKQSEKKIKEATYLYLQIDDNYISHLIIRK